MSLLYKAIVAVVATSFLCVGSIDNRAATKSETKPGPMRCRMYFGCAPANAATSDIASNQVQ